MIRDKHQRLKGGGIAQGVAERIARSGEGATKPRTVEE